MNIVAKAQPAGPGTPALATRFNRLGALVAGIIAAALLASPFVTFRANRIVAGEPRPLLDALPLSVAVAILIALTAVGVVAVLVRRPSARLAAAGCGLMLLLPALGWAARFATPPGD